MLTTFVRPQGYTQGVCVSDTECKYNLLFVHKKTPQGTFKICRHGYNDTWLGLGNNHSRG